MLERVRTGQATFYNGTYAQPHLQTLSSESNFRQFEWGTRVYRRFCPDHPVTVYVHQESSVHEQAPQLLQAFGIPSVTFPHFSSTLVFLDGGEMVVQWWHGTMFMHGEEFARWRGLDRSEVDLYLDEPVHGRIGDWLAFQKVTGLTHVPPIIVSIPDLVNVDEAWMQERAQADFVLLEETLAERRREFPPRFHVRFYTNWSYIEGIRAEELSRGNWKAESAALRLEALDALAFTLTGRAPESTDAVWKRILTTQHHDVYCFCAPELREKAIGWLQEAETEAACLAQRAAQAIATRVDTSGLVGGPLGEPLGEPLVVLNAVPHPQQNVVEAEVDLPDPRIAGPDGEILPSEVVPPGEAPSGRTRVRFLARLKGLGYAACQVLPGGEKPVEETLAGPAVFENAFYRAVVQPDGSFASLRLNPSGEELLSGEASPGNRLAACDSTGLSPRHEGTFEVGRYVEWVKWEPPGRGPELAFQPAGPAQRRSSALGATVTISGTMGAAVKAALTVHFYHALPRIDLDWTFAFEAASIGTFFDDETKLRVQWPLAFRGAIHHDIAFGVVEARDERPFLPASWVDISDGTQGLAYFHQGTLKHWVTGNTLVNLFAWGEDTDAIGNRMERVRWPKCFDQRLRGTHTIRTALYPHAGDWRSADVVGAARSYGMPPSACFTDRHAGSLPPELDVLRLAGTDLAATAVKVDESQAAVVCRFYSYNLQPGSVDAVSPCLKPAGMASLAGDPIDRIGSFQIGILTFNRD
jgi:hypothetical protein